MDELDVKIDEAIKAGLSDEDIQFIVGEWKKAHPAGPRPNDPSMLPGAGKTHTATSEEFQRIPYKAASDVKGRGDYARREVAAAGRRVSEMGDALAKNINQSVHYGEPGHSMPRTTMTDVGNNILGIISGVTTPIKQAWKNTVGDFGSLTPEEAGSGAVDAAVNLPAAAPLMEGAAVGTRAAARGVRTAAGTPAGKFIIAHGTDFLPGATARATRAGFAAMAAQDAAAAKTAATAAKKEATAVAGPKPRLAPRSAEVMSADMLAELESRIPGTIASYQPPAPSLDKVMADRLADAAETGPRAHATSEFTRTNPNAGATLVPNTDALSADLSAQLDALRRVHPEYSDAQLAEAVQQHLDDAAASPARNRAETPHRRVTNEGGTLRPGDDAVAALRKALEEGRQPLATELPLSVSHPQTGTFTLEPQYGDWTAKRTGQPTQISPGIEKPKSAKGTEAPKAEAASAKSAEAKMPATVEQRFDLTKLPVDKQGRISLSHIGNAEQLALRTHLELKLHRTPLEEMVLARLKATAGGMQSAGRAFRHNP